MYRLNWLKKELTGKQKYTIFAIYPPSSCLKNSIKKNNLKIGKIGEEYARNFLISQQFNIIDANYYCRWGEIDIVAKKKDIIIFIEVKTKVGDKTGKPYEAINFYKLKKLKRTISYYLLKNSLNNHKLSLKIISIILNKDYSLKQLKVYDGPDRW